MFSSWDLLNGGQSSDRGHKTDVEKIRKGVKNLCGHIRNRVGVWIIASKKICLFYCEWYRKNETQRKVIYQNLAFSKVYLICIYKIKRNPIFFGCPLTGFFLGGVQEISAFTAKIVFYAFPKIFGNFLKGEQTYVNPHICIYKIQFLQRKLFISIWLVTINNSFLY